MKSISVRFRFCHIEDDRLIPTGRDISLTLNENTTYEEIIHLLIQKQYLLLLEPPLHYSIVFLSATDWQDFPKDRYRPGMHPYGTRYFAGREPPALSTLRSEAANLFLREGQTLTSTHLINNRTQQLNCYIFTEVKASPPPKEIPSSTSPSVGEIINIFLMSPAVNIINLTASVVTITTTLILIDKWWSKKHSTESASSEERSSQPSESEIMAIRLRMTHGPDHEFEEWLTEPARLKHYIDVFNEPSSSIQPLQAVFVQRNGKAIKVDVSKGAQNNLQLNEVLSYLHIDSEQK